MGNRRTKAICPICKAVFASKKSLSLHAEAVRHTPGLRIHQSKYINDHQRRLKVQKPNVSASIANVFANETIPGAFLQKLVSENRSAFGFAVRLPDGKIDVEKFFKDDVKDAEKMFKDLTQILDNTKKQPLMLSMHDFRNEFDEDEVMPLSILRDSKNNPILCLAAEGDFPAYTGKFPEYPETEGFSEAYKFVYTWLGPKIEQVYSMVGNDLTKTVAYLKSEQFKKDFAAQIGHRASIHFMPSQGDPFVIEKNDIGIDATWGNASNAYGYTESAIAAATPEPAKAEAPKPRTSKYADSPTEPAAPAAPAAAPPPVPQNNPPPVPATPTDKVADEITWIDWTPPANLQGKALKEAYRSVNNGQLPDDWDKRPTIKIKATNVVKSLKDLDKTAAGTTNGQRPTIYSLPVINGDKLKKMNEYVKKNLGDGSAPITDPTAIQLEIGKVPLFTNLCPHVKDIREIFHWRRGFLHAFVKEHPESATLAIAEALKELIAAEELLGKATAPQTQTGTEPAKPSETGPSVNPAPAVTPAPATPAEQPKKSKYA